MIFGQIDKSNHAFHWKPVFAAMAVVIAICVYFDLSVFIGAIACGIAATTINEYFIESNEKTKIEVKEIIPKPQRPKPFLQLVKK